MSRTLGRSGVQIGAVIGALTIVAACGADPERPVVRGADRLPGAAPGAVTAPASTVPPTDHGAAIEPAGNATTDPTEAAPPRDLGPAGLAPERAATALLAAVGPDGALPATAVVPGIELDPALLRHLPSGDRRAGAPATSTTTIRDDGVRADVRIELDDLTVVVTLLRWEGRWRVGDLLALQAGPPLVVLDAGADA